MKFDRRLLALARSSPALLSLTVLSGFAGGVLTVLQARFLSQVIGRVFLGGESLGMVVRLLEILLAIILLRAGLLWVGEVSANALAVRVKGALRRRLFARILELGPSYTNQESASRGVRTGELANAAVEGIEALDSYFSQYLPQVFLAAVLPATFLVMIFPLDPLSALVLLLTAPLIPIFMILIGHLAEALTRRQWQTLGRLSAHFLDVLQGLATLKMLGRSRAQIQVVDQVGERFRQATMSVLRVTFLSSLALELIATLSTAVVAVEIGLRLLYGRLTFEQAFFVLLLAPEFYLPLRMLGTRFHAGMAGVAAAERIFEILETEEGTIDERRRTNGDSSSSFVFRPFASLRAGSSSFVPPIRFEDVHYTYPGDRPALRGVSFSLEPGRKTALVGPSGAGKSTLAAVLLRFVEPDCGQVRVGDQPLHAIPPAVWRSQVAWVPQRPYLFQDTVAANIRLGCPGASLEAVIQAARQANAHEFILELPQGYETRIGERGARLSGGQAQRIALARAFLKNAPILILDEATASLDPLQEQAVSEAVQRLVAGRTVLIIAHRLSTVYQADQILLLDKGRLAAAGDHATLLEQDGLYRRLVNAYSGPPDTADRTTQIENHLSIQFNPTAELKKASRFHHSPQAPTIPSVPPVPLRSPLPRLLRLISPFKRLVFLSVLLGFATIGSSVGLMAASAYIIASAALQPSIAILQVPIVGVRFFGISRGVFRYLERYCSHQVTFHLLRRLRTWFYAALEPLAPARLAGYRSGDLLSRAIGDIAALENFYVRVLAPPLSALLVALAVFAFFSFYSPVLAACLLFFLLLAGLGLPLLTGMLGRGPGAEILKLRADLNAALVDGIQGLADLLAFGQEGRQLERVDSAGRELGRLQRCMARIGGLNSALSGLLSNLGMLSVLTLAIPMVRAGQIDGVHLAVLTLAALASFEAVQPLPAAAQTMGSNLEAARRLFALVDAAPEVRDPEAPLELPGREGYDIEVKGLSFRYREGTSPPQPPSPRGRGGGRPPWSFTSETSGSSQLITDDERRGGRIPRVAPGSPEFPKVPVDPTLPDILKDLSFSLPYGKRLAVVGPSGSGKSTIVHLLLRFWEFEQGEILLGGQDIRRFRQEDVRSLFAVVSQNTYLFNATVRDNLLLANPNATEAQIVDAARQAQIHDFICSLPEGYDTWIGEQGLRLSGGERQRLAIARALLKGAPFLILDEPTANLDPLTEREILRSIAGLLGDRTWLVITHRLVELEAMDEILVLHQGRIVERGRHLELVELGGIYRQMWELQNQALVET